jgi:hypothetical protein
MLHSTLSGGGMPLPNSIIVAASGNVWVSSYLSAVPEFSPAGAAVFPAGISGNGINQSFGMALDTQGKRLDCEPANRAQQRLWLSGRRNRRQQRQYVDRQLRQLEGDALHMNSRCLASEQTGPNETV